MARIRIKPYPRDVISAPLDLRHISMVAVTICWICMCLRKFGQIWVDPGFRLDSKGVLLLAFSAVILVIIGNSAAYIWLHTNQWCSENFFFRNVVRKIVDGNRTGDSS